MAKVLVTAAESFIGAPLIRELTANAYETIKLTRKSGDIAAAETWAHMPPADHLVHLAARTYVPDSWDSPADFVEANVVGTARALDYCRERKAHMVFASTYVYGSPNALPISEDHPVAPGNPYALSKYLAEQLCVFHAQVNNLPVTILRLFNVYGPGQKEEFLIPTILKQVAEGRQVCVENLAPRRDYIYLDDVLAAFLKAIRTAEGCRIFNIGSGISFSVMQVIEAAQSIAGTSLAVVEREHRRKNEVADVRADISAARKGLGWSPANSMLDGLAKLMNKEH